jgi:hypothetical protein
MLLAPALLVESEFPILLKEIMHATLLARLRTAYDDVFIILDNTLATRTSYCTFFW